MGNEELTNYIVIDQGIRFGKPCIKDTRITVGDIFQWLSVRSSSMVTLRKGRCRSTSSLTYRTLRKKSRVEPSRSWFPAEMLRKGIGHESANDTNDKRNFGETTQVAEWRFRYYAYGETVFVSCFVQVGVR
jgi:hypothetical protein